jgi:protein-L-isoaspartate(D-aspartate) O-methyltransferase
VLDPVVLSLLSTVRREDFVPPAHKALAFVDTQVPLGGGPGGPVMLEPKVQARLLQELQVQRHEKVLDIGTGSGFMAALLAHRAQQVFTLECNPALARMARENLRHSGIVNATVVECSAAEGARGLPAEAPFDVILLSGSVAELPRALLEQLKIGGRLAAIVGDLPIMTARLVRRAGPDAWSETDLFDTVAPRLAGFEERPRFVF